MADETATEAIMDTCAEFADYLKSVTNALADNKITALEMRKVGKELTELVAMAGKLQAVLASMQAKGARRT